MLQPNTVVEVGTYRGYAACYMARAIQENNRGKLYCIDDFSESMQKPTTPDEWHENLLACGVRDWATLLVGRSDKIKWPENVDLAYIDGWHSYAAVHGDFRKCAMLGASVICLDDTTYAIGPRQFVADLQRPKKKGTGNGKWTEIEGLSWPDHDIPGEWNVLEFFSDHGLAVCVRKSNRPCVHFSQELAGKGQEIENDKLLEHLMAAKAVTGIDYWAMGSG